MFVLQQSHLSYAAIALLVWMAAISPVSARPIGHDDVTLEQAMKCASKGSSISGAFENCIAKNCSKFNKITQKKEYEACQVDCYLKPTLYKPGGFKPVQQCLDDLKQTPSE